MRDGPQAAKFARKTVDSQREQFKRFGIWGDWEEPYMTLLPEYEAAQVRAWLVPILVARLLF